MGHKTLARFRESSLLKISVDRSYLVSYIPDPLTKVPIATKV